MNLSKKQKLAVNWYNMPEYKNYNGIICDGAVRSGKTFALSIGFVVWAMTEFKNQNFAICGKTVTSLKRNITVPLLDLLRANGFECTEKVSKNYFDMKFRHTSNRFYIFGGKDEGSAALIQGMTLAGVLFDEVVLMPESFVNQAIARCSIENSKLWFDCNPENPAHWFYREWIKKHNAKKILYLHFTMDDNISLAPEIIERYKTLYHGVFYERFILGNWTAATGAVYPMFDEKNMVLNTNAIPEYFEKYVCSCDYGTVNPCSIGLWGKNNGVWYRIREYYYDSRREGMSRTDEEHYSALERLTIGLKLEAITVDPSAASFIECISRHGKYRVIKANNDVVSGIRKTAVLLKQGKLKFSAECKDIIREFTLYRWDEGKNDAPVKQNDHAMDDMRYFVSTYIELYDNRNDFCAVNVARK